MVVKVSEGWSPRVLKNERQQVSTTVKAKTPKREAKEMEYSAL